MKTVELELKLAREREPMLWNYADADFAFTADRLSIARSVMTLAGNAVFSFRSKRKRPVA